VLSRARIQRIRDWVRPGAPSRLEGSLLLPTYDSSSYPKGGEVILGTIRSRSFSRGAVGMPIMTSLTGGCERLALTRAACLAGCWTLRLEDSDHDGERGFLSGECAGACAQPAPRSFTYRGSYPHSGNRQWSYSSDFRAWQGVDNNMYVFGHLTWGLTISIIRVTFRSTPLGRPLIHTRLPWATSLGG